MEAWIYEAEWNAMREFLRGKRLYDNHIENSITDSIGNAVNSGDRIKIDIPDGLTSQIVKNELL